METKLNTTMLERLEVAASINRRAIFMRELKAGSESYSFQPPAEDVLLHTVVIKRAILGKDVDPTELCMIELETRTDVGTVEKFPLAYLRGTDMLQASLDMVLTEAATVKLAKGNGPVYIIGEYAQEWKEEEGEAEESVDGDVEAEAESEEEEDIKENGSTENKENTEVLKSCVEAAAALAADRKRKHEGSDVAGSKKLRVAKGNEGEEPMDEVPETTTA